MCRYSVFGQGVADIIVVLLGQHFRAFVGPAPVSNNILNAGVGQVVIKSSMLIMFSSRVDIGCQSIEGQGGRGPCGW